MDFRQLSPGARSSLNEPPNDATLPSRRLQLQQQVAQLGALARKARLGSLAHPPGRGSLLQLHFRQLEAFL